MSRILAKARSKAPPSTAPTYKVAVIQLYPKPMQPENNFEKAAKFIRSASVQGAQLAVLPEYHLTNWLPHDPKFAALCADWEKYLHKYQELARECNICIVPGTIVQTRDASGDDKSSTPTAPPSTVPQKHDADSRTTYVKVPQPGGTGGPADYRADAELANVAYFISNDGTVIGSYTKKNLWGPTERAHLSSSGREAHPVFDTPLGRVGILICWDLAFPEAFRELIVQGAKIIILPTFWTMEDCSDAGLRQNVNAEAVFLDATLTARAFENTCAIIFANAGGPPGRGYAGLSQVTVPFIGPIARLGSCAEGMSVIDLDMQIVEDAEEQYQVRADLARDDWHYDYRHDAGFDKEKKETKL